MITVCFIPILFIFTLKVVIVSYFYASVSLVFISALYVYTYWVFSMLLCAY